MNQSPFYLLHGYHPKSIFDYNLISTDTAPKMLNEFEKLNNIRDELPKLLEEKFEKNRKHYDSHKKGKCISEDRKQRIEICV